MISPQQTLGQACREGNGPKAYEALDAGANVDALTFWTNGHLDGPHSATSVSTRWGRTAFLRDVLLPPPVSADPNKGDAEYGLTPLHEACLYDHPDTLTVLMAYGADPNQTTHTCGATPCMLAARHGNTACLRALAEGAALQEGRTLDVNALATGGYVDLMNAGWDHQRAKDCGGYDCLMRLMTFHTTIAVNRSYDIAFTATNPQRPPRELGDRPQLWPG